MLQHSELACHSSALKYRYRYKVLSLPFPSFFPLIFSCFLRCYGKKEATLINDVFAQTF